MGIKLETIDETNIYESINLYKSASILTWIPTELITREVCLAAVKANGLAVKFVPAKFAVREVLLAAINQTHQALWSISRRLIDSILIRAATASLLKQCTKVYVSPKTASHQSINND